jgi:hypothetical protein
VGVFGGVEIGLGRWSMYNVVCFAKRLLGVQIWCQSQEGYIHSSFLLCLHLRFYPLDIHLNINVTLPLFYSSLLIERDIGVIYN